MEHHLVNEDNVESFVELLQKKVHFVISYFAKKHNKLIIRNAMWTDKCKIDADKGTITYFDTDANGYRTATQGIQIAIRKEGETIQ